VRTVILDTDEYVGANVIISPETINSIRIEQTMNVNVVYCRRCTRAAEMTEIWNQFKDPAEHASITHCIVCDKIVLSLPRNAYKNHHPPDYCQAHYHADSGMNDPQHRRHDNTRSLDRTTCQPLPLNNPASLQTQIDEGGNPFGNIPQDMELCFANSRMLQPREKPIHTQAWRKGGKNGQRKSPPTSCQGGFKLL